MNTETQSPQPVGSSAAVRPDSCGLWRCGECGITVFENEHGELLGRYSGDVDLLNDLLDNLRGDGATTTPCCKAQECYRDECCANRHNNKVSHTSGRTAENV